MGYPGYLNWAQLGSALTETSMDLPASGPSGRATLRGASAQGFSIRLLVVALGVGA